MELRQITEISHVVLIASDPPLLSSWASGRLIPAINVTPVGPLILTPDGSLHRLVGHLCVMGAYCRSSPAAVIAECSCATVFVGVVKAAALASVERLRQPC